MVHEIDLNELAALHGPERAFLSLYLRSGSERGWLDDRLRRLHGLLEHDAEREHLEANESLLREHFAEHPAGPEPLAMFVCWALGELRVHPLRLPVENRLRIGATPFLRPLAELQDEHEVFAVVAADNSVSRIFLVRSDRPREAARVRGDIKNHVKVGGQSQMRYERRREHALGHYAREVVEALRELAAVAPFEHLVLVGSQETMREIRDELPQALADKLIDDVAVDLEDDEQVWGAAFALMEEEERREERDLWQEIRGAYLQGGGAAIGVEEVLMAAAAGRVAELLVVRDTAGVVTRCRACENVSAGERSSCAVCGSDDVFETDLVGALVELVERFGGSCEFADPLPELAEQGGVAARLRY